MKTPLEEMSLEELQQHHTVFSQVNHITGKIKNPGLAAQAEKLIKQKRNDNEKITLF